MKTTHAVSVLLLGCNASRLNPVETSPGYNDWFEHPNYYDQDYSEYYTRDLSNMVGAKNLAQSDYLDNPKNQYYVDNDMAIKPDVDWDSPVENLQADVLGRRAPVYQTVDWPRQQRLTQSPEREEPMQLQLSFKKRKAPQARAAFVQE